MAALSGRGDCIDNSGGKLKSPQLTPQKVRNLLNEGIATEDSSRDIGFLERYKSCCLLELQLPSMKPDDLINMSLTEDIISLLLQLIEDELKQEGGSPVKYNTEPLSVQVAACIVALCGWTCSPSLDSMSLPVITCSYCMRKVGLWGFQQIESICSEGDSSFGIASTPVSCHDGRGERLTPTPVSPCRMVLRSQDTTPSHTSEPSDLIPSPIVARTRSQEFHSPSPVDETTSTVLRGKRPVTRSMGQGEMVGVGSEVPSSPQRKAKRLRLCSSSSSDIMINRSFFDPIFQHRDWCPWVRMAEEQRVREQATPSRDHPSQCGITENLQPAWKAVLEVFVSMKKSNNPEGGNSSQVFKQPEFVGAHRYHPCADSGGAKMNTRCPPKRVPSAARFFTHCELTVQPPQSYSVGGQRSSGQLTGKPAGARPDYRGRWCTYTDSKVENMVPDLGGNSELGYSLASLTVNAHELCLMNKGPKQKPSGMLICHKQTSLSAANTFSQACLRAVCSGITLSRLMHVTSEYIQKYATEEALKEQEEGAGDSSSESSMSDFSEDEAQDMEL
ncbi:UNVERIFIED_CONTAM: hypothetical protein FKN15_027314 [Acipenser sinensis]